MGVGIAVVAGGVFVSLGMPGFQSGNAQGRIEAVGPLISRGYTDAPAGTAVIAGDPLGGNVVIDLRIAEGQVVKKDEIVAVLNHFPSADVDVRKAESELKRAEQQRESMVSGYRTTEIEMQEGSVKSATEEGRLKVLELSRSSMPPDQKQIQTTLSEQSVEKQQARLRVQREALAADIANIDTDIRIIKTKLEAAKLAREQALVRSPLDGVVTQIYTRRGEAVSRYGIAKLVDLSQLRIFADVDEIHLPHVQQGGKVEFTFQGSRTVHVGTIVRVPFTVKRTKRSDADFGESNARLVEVEIAPDNLSTLPLMLGREARVVFQ